ncbi:YEATS-associated helix-containing protein [Gynuella sp.]|uniref:YEATS-associated helix-containing protein n=1 Tax=Gynuella sp. TaxID=2969146 RepID=UPI003D0B2645
MANHIFILIAVMLLAGVFGGLVNFYLQGQHDPDTTSLPRSLVVGVGASFLVPVLLDLVNSELILESQGDPSRLLIFTGFCLIAAIASRFFIVNVSDRILSEAHSAKESAERLQHDLRIIQNNLMPLIETETEQESGVDDNLGPLAPEDELDVTTANVLKTLGSGRYIFRSLAGLCHETNTDESTMVKTLNIMVARNLAGRTMGKKGMRWHITEKGRRALEVSIS